MTVRATGMIDEESRRWWQTRTFVFALVLLSALPLVWPDIPPLVDLPGHMGRYEVQLSLPASPGLRRFYEFDWGLIGNLGIDLWVIGAAKLFGLELAVKLIVLAIPPLTVAGFLWVSREVAGELPPTALFAAPLAYGFPFQFGFLNFSLSMALAFLAFALWLRLARLGHFAMRAAVFVPISLVTWLVHTYGWGALGVMAFSAELVRQHDCGRSFIKAGFRAALHCLAMAPPVLLMLLWRSGAHVEGRTLDWFNWERKFDWLIMTLRDRWEIFDLASLAIIGVLLLFALFSRRLEYSRNLAASAIFLIVVYLLLPRIVFGSAYADMRLAPYMIAVAVIGIRLKPGAGRRFASMLAVLGTVFLLVRTVSTSASFWLYDRTYDRILTALDHVPRDARMVAFVGRDCADLWTMSRLEHLPAMGIVRRHAFSNDQWAMAGAQLLVVDYAAGRGFNTDPSQIVIPVGCRGAGWRTIDQALADFPRRAFDYVWLIDPPPYDRALTAGLEGIWRSGTSVLYRVVDRSPPAAANEDDA